MGGERPPARVLSVELVPAPGFPAALARDLAQRLSRRVEAPCRVSRLRCDAPPPRLRGRDQVDADAFLAQIEGLGDEPGRALVGLTTADLGHPIFTFFFGRARHGGGAAIVSLARLDPAFYGLGADRETTLRRAVQEILHELGHVAGLGHCKRHACVMRFVAHVEALDTRGTDLCAACAQQLSTARY